MSEHTNSLYRKIESLEEQHKLACEEIDRLKRGDSKWQTDKARRELSYQNERLRELNKIDRRMCESMSRDLALATKKLEKCGRLFDKIGEQAMGCAAPCSEKIKEQLVKARKLLKDLEGE
jgi:hypothetical protein